MASNFFIFTVGIFSVILNSQSKVEAYYYVGTYESGLKAYIMEETILGRNGKTYFTIEAVYPSGKYLRVNYMIYYAGTTPYFENSQGFSGRIDRYNTPVEWNAYQFITNN